MKKSKILSFTILLLFFVLFYSFGLHKELSLERIQLRLEDLKKINSERPLLMLMGFMGSYILITSLSIPGAIVLTLLAGTLFGVMKGTFLVTLACTIGATVAFFLSRFLFRETIYHRFRSQFIKINEKLHRDGNVYLFTLRLIPVSPFVVINLLMGITSIKPWSFIWITFVSMIPGNLIYVFAGKEISEIERPEEILTWPVIFLLVVIGLLPLLLKKGLSHFRSASYD